MSLELSWDGCPGNGGDDARQRRWLLGKPPPSKTKSIERKNSGHILIHMALGAIEGYFEENILKNLRM